MKPAEFGQLVKELRKSTSDPLGNQWTRESLSKYIHLSVDQLGRLERGERKYYDHQTLNLLADAFKLTTVEKKEFLITAAGISDAEFTYNASPDEQLNDLINVAGSVLPPAFIVDAFNDLVAINQTYKNLFMITDEIIGYARQLKTGFNLLYYLYSADLGFKDLLGPSWKKIALIQIHQFRRTSFRFRHEKYYKILLQELFKEPQFDIDWYSSNRLCPEHCVEYEYFNFEHPAFGLLSFIGTETNVNTAHGELHLVIYHATDGPTTLTFNQLAGPNKVSPTLLANWPEKPV